MNHKLATDSVCRRPGFDGGAGLIAVVLISVLMVGLCVTPASAQEESDESAVSPRLIHAMSELPMGYAVPLYPMGDVDESGTVDAIDRQLIHALARTEEQNWGRISAVSCPGAGDLNIDGAVDDEDTAIADELLAEAPISTPALFYQAALACRFERLTVAVELFVLSGEETPLYILRGDADNSNTSVSVDSGPATVRRAEDERVFLIDVAADAKTGDTVVLGIRFSEDEAYWLSVPVQATSDIKFEDP